MIYLFKLLKNILGLVMLKLKKMKMDNLNHNQRKKKKMLSLLMKRPIIKERKKEDSANIIDIFEYQIDILRLSLSLLN